jgi:type II secretory pathway pseudopilin PulG
MPVKAKNEDGFTMIMTVIGITLIALLAAVAVTAVNGSTQITGRDLARKQAYEAALAGINEYSFHLHKNPSYWTECTNAVPAGETSALNQVGSTANRRMVPGTSGASYALELIPATGHTECVPGIETATSSMLEALEPLRGTFRVRATGYFGKAKVAVTATFKPASFLDYVYFTQLETSDPVTYGNAELKSAAERQCTKTIYEGRYTTALKNSSGQMLTPSGTTTTNKESAEYCDVISFVGADNIEGPMHTNDAFAFCESPTLGRDKNDPIEVSYPVEKGWFSTKELLQEWERTKTSCVGNNTNVKGRFQINSPALIPPKTNSELAKIAEESFRFSGEIAICMEGTVMKVGSGKSCTATPLYSGPFPANGVIYDGNKNNECNTEYTPFNVSYESTVVNTCGNVNIVKGQYAKPLTIAAANNVLIMANVKKTTEEGMLGLIATNFIRIYHPVTLVHPQECTPEYDSRGRYLGEKCVENTNEWKCTGNAPTGVLENLEIEAALLALEHSIIVDNYRCGARLGLITVKGALAQKYRGAVGTTGSNGNGYLKHYVYDNRFKTTEPPSFIEPVKSDWVIGRETVE